VLKGATKTLAKIKKLLQAYAIAQPSCRFSLKALKAKNENNNWMYVPGTESEISDAAIKVVGRDVCSSCLVKDVSSKPGAQEEGEGANLSSSEYHLTAFLPKPDAGMPSAFYIKVWILTSLDFSKINKSGQFISLDGRPLSSSRGISQDIVKLFKKYLRSVANNAENSITMTDPFLCLKIGCPRGVYDVNIEPGKDDVVFQDREIIISLVERIFQECYGQLPADTKKSPTKGKTAPPSAARMDGGFDILMARKDTEIPVRQNRGSVMRESTIDGMASKSPFQSPSGRTTVHRHSNQNVDTQVQGNEESITSTNPNSRFINPWSITKMSTPLQTPGHNRGTFNRASLLPRIHRNSPESQRADSVSSNHPQSPPETPNFRNAEATSVSPISTRHTPQSPRSPVLSNRLTGSSCRRAARERDRERYGNGSLDTLFQRTNQIAMGQTPPDQPATIDEVIPTLSQLANERFSARDTHQANAAAIDAASAENTTVRSDNSEAQCSPRGETSTDAPHEGSMNSGRGYPVLEHWTASLKEGFGTNRSSGLEWAMDFERRKKEANQKRQLDLVSNQSSNQHPDSLASQGPHQNRFQAAKAALATDQPFASELKSKSRLCPDDPRAYMMIHQDEKSSENQDRGSSKSRRLHTSRMPFERIPDGCDLHNTSLSLPTNISSVSKLFELMISDDSYLNDEKQGGSFDHPDMDTHIPFWTQRLQSLIDRKYKSSSEFSCSNQLDLAIALANHLQHRQ